MTRDELSLWPLGRIPTIMAEQVRPWDPNDPRPGRPDYPGSPPDPIIPPPVPPGVPGPPVLEPPVPPPPAPAPPSVPAPIDPPRIIDLPAGGPFDVMEPTPWDPYRYPPTPAPPSLPTSAAVDMRLYKAMKRFLDWEPDEDKDKPRKRLPGDPPQRPQLPAGALLEEDRAVFYERFGVSNPTQEQVRNALRAPTTSGVIGSPPHELLDAYLQRAGIRYFSAKELTSHRWRKATNWKRVYSQIYKDGSIWWFAYETFPPDVGKLSVWFVLMGMCVPHPALWPSILPALRVLDRYRHYTGRPVRAFSGYRLPEYNRRVKGSKDSFHMSMAAIDFYPPFRLPNGEADVAHFRAWFEKLYRVKGDGVGAYPTFCHLDVGMQRHLLDGKAENWTHVDRKDRTGLRKDATVGR